MALLGNVSAVQLKDDSIYDPAHYAGLYTNVLLDVDAFRKKHGNKHHHHHDAYDYDPDTVSQYDNDPQHTPWSNKERKDWFEEREKHLNQKIYDLQTGA